MDLINKFIGFFVIDVADKDVKKIAQEFIDKVKELERQLHLTQDMYLEFKKKLTEAQIANNNKENSHLSN